MTEREALVRNDAGIHCRPSTAIVEAMRDYAGELSVEAGGESTDLRSVMGLMALQLASGSRVRVRVDGPDEETVAAKLVELLETRFDFPKR